MQQQVDEMRRRLPDGVRNHQYLISHVGQSANVLDSKVSGLCSSVEHARVRASGVLTDALHSLQVALKPGKSEAQLQAAIHNSLSTIQIGRSDLDSRLASFERMQRAAGYPSGKGGCRAH